MGKFLVLGENFPGVERGAGAGAGGSPGSSLTGGSSPKGILREPAFLSNRVMPIKK